MSERFHLGTFMWGVVLTISGAALAAVGFGWWDLSVFDLRYIAPAFVILVGVVILVGAAWHGGHGFSNTDTPT